MRKIFKHMVAIFLLIGFAVLALGSMASSPNPKLKTMEYQKVSSLKEIDFYAVNRGYIVEVYLEYNEGGSNSSYGLTLLDRDNGLKAGPIRNFHGDRGCRRYHSGYSCSQYESYYFGHYADAYQQFRPRIDTMKKYNLYIGVYNGEEGVPYIDKIEGLETIIEIEARRKIADEQFGKEGTPNSQDDFEVRQNAQGGITITKYKGIRKWVIIPNTLYGQRVTEIGAGAFSDNSDIEITNIVIPNTVTHIRFRAFAYNKQLTELVLPDALIEIEASAFLGCGLTSLRLGNRIQEIGMAAFGDNNISTLVVTSATTKFGAQSLFGQFITTSFESNPLTRITLPANMSDNNVKIINSDLGSYYIGQGKKAGTYVKNGPVWNRE
jgi:hypothetical protein